MKRVSTSVVMLVLVAVAMVIPVAGAVFVDTTAAPASSIGASNTFSALRSVTYQVSAGAFSGTTYTLQLDQPLEGNYFVMLRGAAGNGSSGTNRGPDENFARISGDPHGNFGVVTAPDQLQLERRGSAGDWQGSVVVVESLRDWDTAGFRLLDVVERTMGPGVTTASSTAATWSSLAQVGLYGGQHGGGVDATTADRRNHQAGWARIYPSGSNAVNFERQSGSGGTLAGTSRFTTYVVEWGSEWTIQRATVSGSAAGATLQQLSHYDTASISPVARDETFVTANGRAASNRLSAGWEGQVFTLGNGVAQNPTESTVAVGARSSGGRVAEVYVHTHSELVVDYRFGPDGSIGRTALTGTVTVDPSIDLETYVPGMVARTGESRFVVFTNSSAGSGVAYPRSMVWARATGAAAVAWTRSRSGQQGAYWLQAVDAAQVGANP